MKTIQIPLKGLQGLELTKKLRSLGLINFKWNDDSNEVLTADDKVIKAVPGLTEQPEFTASNNILEVKHWWGGFKPKLGWGYFRLKVSEEAENILKANKIEFSYE
jgi:hypothetical protein